MCVCLIFNLISLFSIILIMFLPRTRFAQIYFIFFFIPEIFYFIKKVNLEISILRFDSILIFISIFFLIQFNSNRKKIFRERERERKLLIFNMIKFGRIDEWANEIYQLREFCFFIFTWAFVVVEKEFSTTHHQTSSANQPTNHSLLL